MPHIILIVSEVRLPLRGDPERSRLVPWIHFSIRYSMAIRNPGRDDITRMITLLQRSNLSPRCRQAASNEVCVLVRCTTIQMLYYCTAEIWELLYTLSCPVATTCEKRVFSKNFKNNNHNLIKKYKLFHFRNVQFNNAFYGIQILK